MSKAEKVYQVVSWIPRGEVLTYSAVAKLSGVENPRFVGNILHKNPDPKKIPCHRVVNSQGKVAKNFAFGRARGQIKKLLNEGVEVQDGKVDLNKFIWTLRS